MPRPLSDALLAAVQSTNLRPVAFVAPTFLSETVYVWTGVGDKSWNGHTWKGLGALLAISVPEDAAAVEAKGLSITFSGFDATLLPEALNDYQLGLPVIVYFGAYAADGTLIADPAIAWAGRMDQPTIDVTGATATIEINCESRLVEMNTAVDRRYTHQDTQLDNPGDLGCMFVDGIIEMTLFWGLYPNSSNNI